jgi:hypothetical protein
MRGKANCTAQLRMLARHFISIILLGIELPNSKLIMDFLTGQPPPPEFFLFFNPFKLKF